MVKHRNHPHSVTGYRKNASGANRNNKINDWDDVEDNDSEYNPRGVRASSSRSSSTVSAKHHPVDDSWGPWGDDGSENNMVERHDDVYNETRGIEPVVTRLDDDENDGVTVDETIASSASTGNNADSNVDSDVNRGVASNASNDSSDAALAYLNHDDAHGETLSKADDSEDHYNDAWNDLSLDDFGGDEWNFAISEDMSTGINDNNDDAIGYTEGIEHKNTALNDDLDDSLNDDPSEDIVSPDAIAVTDDAIVSVAGAADDNVDTSRLDGNVNSDGGSDAGNSVGDDDHSAVATDDKPESLLDAPSSIDEYMDVDNDTDVSPLSHDEEDLDAIKNAMIDAGLTDGDNDNTDLDDLLDEGPGEASLLDSNHHEHDDSIEESSPSRDPILDGDYPDDMDAIIADAELAKKDESDADMTLSLHREYDYYDLNAAAGMPIWIDEDTLEFIFSIRYNSPAFDGSLLQEDYRVMVHKSFSDLIRTLIQQKLDMMSRRPDLYKNASRDDNARRPDPNADAGFMDPIASIDSLMNNLDDSTDDVTVNDASDNNNELMNGYRLDTIDKDGIIDIATGMGIDPASIDVLTLIADVVDSLSKIVVRTIEERPGMNPAEKQTAILFMRSQLWDENAQLRWRAVSANMLAAMYSYEALPLSVKIIRALDALITEEMRGGALQASDITTTFMNEWLSDAVIQYVMHAIIENPDTTPELMIDEAIEDIRTGDWQNP